MYITVDATLTRHDLTLQKLTEAAKEVWQQSRFEHPEIACKPVWEDTQCMLEYLVPNPRELDDWIERSLHVEASARKPDDIYTEIGQRGSDDAVQVYVVAPSSTKTSSTVTDLYFVFHLNHLFFDGTGAHLTVGHFLKKLARKLGRQSEQAADAFRWNESVKNLSPAFLAFLPESQRTSGPEFEAAAGRAFQQLMASQVRKLHKIQCSREY